MTSYDALQHLEVSVSDGIATVVFAPQQEGDLEDSFFVELRDVFAPLGYDSDVKAVVLTGKGDVFFSGVGHQRTARLLNDGGFDVMAGQIQTLQGIVNSMLAFRKPVVSAINGKAENIGAQIALLSDAAIASTTAEFGDRHVSGGVAAGDGGTMLWPPLVGMARSREILLHGAKMSAAEAKELHLVVEVVEQDRVYEVALEFAKKLGALPYLPYFATKLTLNNWWRLSSMLSWDLALAYEAGGLVQPHYVEKIVKSAEAHGS